MRKQLLFIGYVVFSTTTLFGQELTLQQFISNANKEAVFQSDWQVEIDALKLKIAQSKRIPLIYGEANLQRNLIVPTTPVPAIAFNPGAAEGEFLPLRFATNWSAKAGVQLAFDIYSSEMEGNIKEAKLAQQKSLIDQKETNRTSTNELSDLYAQVVLAQSQLIVAEKLLDDYLQTLEVMEQRFKAGRVSQVEYNNTLKKGLELEQLEQEAQLVLLNKKIALLPYYELDLGAKFTTPFSEIQKTVIVGNSTVTAESLTLDKQINDLKIRNINRLAIPKLTLNGYLGTQFYNNEFRLANGDFWFGTSYVNLSLRVPITEAFERGLTKKQLIVQSLILDSKLSVANSDDGVTDLQKKNQILVLKKKIESQEIIVQLAEMNVEIMKTQVKEGTQLIVDLNKEIESLIDQQKKLWQAQYDLLQKQME